PLEVPPGKKVSDLERWRIGPSKASAPQIVKSLDLVAETGGTELGRLELDAAVAARQGAAGGRQGAGNGEGSISRSWRERRLVRAQSRGARWRR
ncbi:hypothetical protein, partial [Hamadaea sp.]|uniref:hypothetical protein n=1 Tax=Hamadaea sp. TaxID=2024425 RepID=UPI0025BFE74C